MAITKSKTLPNGAVGDYWRIMDITIDRQALVIHANIALFKDQATSIAGAPPLGGFKHFRFTYTMSELTGITNVVSWVYTKILAAANVMRTVDIDGTVLGSPVPSDPDIFDGTSSL